MMKITFLLPYQPRQGERLLIVGSLPSLGKDNPDGGLRMDYLPERGVWHRDIRLNGGNLSSFTYSYIIKGDNEKQGQKEWGLRFFAPEDYFGYETVVLWDYWKPPNDSHAIFDRAPFRNIFFQRRDKTLPRHDPVRNVNGLRIRMRIAAPRISTDTGLFLGGEIPLLGNWDTQKVMPMRPVEYPFWEAEFNLPTTAPAAFAYKYAAGNRESGSKCWEPGDNRLFPPVLEPWLHQQGRARVLVISDWSFREMKEPWKGAGIAVPVSSLRTENGFGVGEFSDIKRLVDWAKAAGFRLIQLLPVNDTSARGTWHDSYPYGIISAFALHPIYLRLDDLAAPHRALAGEIAEQVKRLNAKPALDYETVMALKISFLRRLFQEDGLRFLRSTEFQNFFSENAHWLPAYSAFCCLRDRFGASDYNRWKGSERGSPEVIDCFTSPQAEHYPAVAFYYYVQFHLHRQLADAAAYAREQGVCLKGDIPIGVALESVETWQHPELFHLDRSAGAPPDFFSDEGQNWAFPTYNWQAMSENNYIWWQERLQHLHRYFDAVRLDHVIGFFRIWTIPNDAVTSLRGRFDPALPLARKDLEDRGIHDIDRFCEPCIGDWELDYLFGESKEEVIRTFLDSSGDSRYWLKPLFATQRQIAAYLQTLPDDKSSMEKRERFRKGLFALIDNVLLIPDHLGGEDLFHPRIFPERTLRFHILPPETREAVQRLHQDYFYARHESFWPQGAEDKLSAMSVASPLMICGEDLGMVPQCVPEVLEKWHILGLRIQRMPEELGRLFGNPAHYPYLSVAATGSHDMPTIRDWWGKEDRALIQIYYQEYLGGKDIAPRICEPWICREIIRLHLQSSSLWAIFPIQDILGMDGMLRRPDSAAERINDPSTPHHNWDYRLHRTLENLLAEKNFIAEVRDMLTAAKRIPY